MWSSAGNTAAHTRPVMIWPELSATIARSSGQLSTKRQHHRIGLIGGGYILIAQTTACYRSGVSTIVGEYAQKPAPVVRVRLAVG